MKKPAPERSAVEAPAAEGAVPVGFNRAPSVESIKLMAVARTMPEPISMKTLTVASGMDKKFVANSIIRWAAKGFLNKIGTGEYKRSNSYPSQA